MADEIYRFGRVVRTDAKLLPIRDCILIYIYSVGTSSKLPVPLLSKDALLVPPILTSRAPWLMGYFETLENEPLTADDVLAVHCFYSPIHKCYFDENDERLGTRHEPCGDHGLDSCGTIDDAVSGALGLPPAPQSDVPDAGVPAGPKRWGVEHAVEVYIDCRQDAQARRNLDNWVYDLEDQLTEAVKRAKVGDVEGHMTALDSSEGFIHLYGKNADKLARVILPILRAAKLPQGSYVLKRYGDPGDAEERVEI